MLVLSRQRDETIMIGDQIEITVVDIRGDKVRLGITAPTRIAVHRKEVYEAIKRENQQAAHLETPDIDELAHTLSPGPQKVKGRNARLGSPLGGTPNGDARHTDVQSTKPASSHDRAHADAAAKQAKRSA